MLPSEVLQKLDDLLLFAKKRQDGDFGKILADVISKVQNIRLSALQQTDIVISFLNKGNLQTYRCCIFKFMSIYSWQYHSEHLLGLKKSNIFLTDTSLERKHFLVSMMSAIARVNYTFID